MKRAGRSSTCLVNGPDSAWCCKNARTVGCPSDLHPNKSTHSISYLGMQLRLFSFRYVTRQLVRLDQGVKSHKNTFGGDVAVLLGCGLAERHCLGRSGYKPVGGVQDGGLGCQGLEGGSRASP